MERPAAETLRLRLQTRPWLVQLLSVPWLLLIEGLTYGGLGQSDRARVFVEERGTGGVVGVTRWLSNGAVTMMAMESDLKELSREQFLQRWSTELRPSPNHRRRAG